MKGRALLEQADRLETLAARAAYSAAVAAFDGCQDDADAWSNRADRLEAQALQARRTALAAA